MRKTFLLTFALAFLATWTVAQQNPPSENTPDQNQATVRGCLTGANGQYRLVDDHHVVYKVSGKDKELSGFDGQQVEITGKLEDRIPPKEKQTASSFARPEHLLIVSGINKISDTCTGASE